MKKTIATKQLRQWRKLDRLAFVVPPLVFLFLSMGRDGRLLWEIIFREQKFTVTVAALLLLLLATGIISLPVVLLWRAVSHTMRKAVIRNATFRVDEDFDYYREILTGISPTTISLLMDLKIETQKDMAALLLKYSKMGAVSMEGGTVWVLQQELSGLLPSDRMLLALIAEGQAQPANLGAWRKQAVTEAVESGKLEYRGMRQNVNSAAGTCLMGCFGGCLIPFILFWVMGIMAVMISKSAWLERVDVFLAAAPQAFGAEQVNYLLSSPDMVIATALTAFIVLTFLFMFLLPVVAAVRTVMALSSSMVWLKRTEEGEILTAQISGLKNFIRDFSNLAEAEKEQLVLWDDFLIYAVVLEENEGIIEDIFRMKNLNYRDFRLF
ncbi:MAG: DUF2207 family protein [Hungatella hathewayi]|uniref:Predicted membrane protein YciQ-like C-terminal domain-containing protein n=1 Tax=Hungatella hathewayi WAL-18680 TaxID=742737 RepID=G5IKZ2_9FIRM|nr:DUF2207 domain-containing protein [Hungatella hathewayi]EHI57831.1 hypothetical protein HMPREF9473_04170 [ [Hungatella hathewayi WAL-18680]MBS4985558.1 DUF2207 domain-containing protein [Hungatella hathewayi]